jgi:hypothetical protein
VPLLQARLANIRQDTTQKMTTDLSKRAYQIRIEDLNAATNLANAPEHLATHLVGRVSRP